MAGKVTKSDEYAAVFCCPWDKEAGGGEREREREKKKKKGLDSVKHAWAGGWEVVSVERDRRSHHHSQLAT